MSETSTNAAEKPINDGGTTPQVESEANEEQEAGETQPSEETGSD